MKFMYTIKDERLKKFLSVIDEEELQEELNEQGDNTSRLFEVSMKGDENGDITISFPKTLTEAKEYDEVGWNPFPDIKPPIKEKNYLVQVKVLDCYGTVYRQKVLRWNGNVNWYDPATNDNVIAWRELPPMFLPKQV